MVQHGEKTFLCGLRRGVKIGKNVFFNNGCSVAAMDRVEIGNDCLFGENVKIYDHNHRFNMKDIPVKKQGYTSNRIIIGNNNWIGSNVVILKGVKIGENCVVGAGCVVDTDIEDNCIVKNIGNYKKEFIVFN